MTKGIMYGKLCKMRFNTKLCLFIMISSVLIMSNTCRASDSGHIDLGLISAETLHAQDGTWIVMDARPERIWRGGHIGTARSFSWEDYTRTDEKGIPYRVMAPEKIADALGKMGITASTPVVIYGDAESSWGGEGWACWVLAWMGHQGPIRLLDGGISAWTKGNYPLSKGDTILPATPERYEFQINPQVLVSREGLQKNPEQYQLVDTRSLLEWVKGRIPNATHISWEKFFSGNPRTPLTPEALKELLEKEGIKTDSTKPVVYYCTGGIRSGYAWMVHELAGLPTAINFEGGTEEWDK